MNNIWQLCPKCNGEGKIFPYPAITSVTSVTCNICSGAGIISTHTGKPPITIEEQKNKEVKVTMRDKEV